jgi:hypothetical protein
MEKFQFVFRYIDDICWLNVGNPQDFLSPAQPRTDNNPFWIYLLEVLEIKPEVTTYDSSNPLRRISANFMNVTLLSHLRTQYESTIKDAVCHFQFSIRSVSSVPI